MYLWVLTIDCWSSLMILLKWDEWMKLDCASTLAVSWKSVICLLETYQSDPVADRVPQGMDVGCGLLERVVIQKRTFMVFNVWRPQFWNWWRHRSLEKREKRRDTISSKWNNWCTKTYKFRTNVCTSSSLWRYLLPALAGVLTFSTSRRKWGAWLVRLKLGDRRPGTNTLLTYRDNKKAISLWYSPGFNTSINFPSLPVWFQCRELDFHRPPEPVWHLYSEVRSFIVRHLLSHLQGIIVKQ